MLGSVRPEQAHAPSPANGPRRGMAAPGSCVPMLSLQRLWFARHRQTCICTLKARRVKGTRKLSPAQTASYDHLVEFDTSLSERVPVKLCTAPILRVGLPSSAEPVWKGRIGYATGGWPRSSAWVSAAAIVRYLLTNNFASLAQIVELRRIESIARRSITRLPIRNHGGRYGRQTGRCRKREGEA